MCRWRSNDATSLHRPNSFRLSHSKRSMRTVRFANSGAIHAPCNSSICGSNSETNAHARSARGARRAAASQPQLLGRAGGQADRRGRRLRVQSLRLRRRLAATANRASHRDLSREIFNSNAPQATARRASFYGSFSYQAVKNILTRAFDLEPSPTSKARPRWADTTRFARDLSKLVDSEGGNERH